jgi:antitoxin HicB
LKYPFEVTPDGPGYMVSFPDVIEAITFVDTQQEAINIAYDCLITTLGFYFDEMSYIPAPSEIQEGQHVVVLPASVAIKVVLLNEMIRQHIAQADLARLMELPLIQVNRLVNLRKAAALDTIDQAFQKLGKSLEFHLSDSKYPPSWRVLYSK